jgi:tRNA (guanine-N7-)-methyltransferase
MSGNRGFTDKRPEEYRRPDINPYLRLHREFGLPVLVGEDAPGFKGHWRDAFAGRDAPLHLEIGSGNGFFLAGMAKRHPDRNWLGLEIRFKRVVLCAKKLVAAGVSNARIGRYDAWHLSDLFEDGALAGLYTNHPDPWPKERHEKKRLIGPVFARWAAGALAPGARWRLKTDHPINVQGMLSAIEGLPFRLVGRSNDVQHDGPPWPADDDIVTNYQRKFYVKDEPIYAVEVERITGPVVPPHADGSAADAG